eukprot:3893456-Alexandrium_andersonii.AAC.1
MLALGSLDCKGSKVQSAIRSRLAAAIRLHPQSALPNTQNGVRRLELELRGPKSGLNIDARSSRG